MAGNVALLLQSSDNVATLLDDVTETGTLLEVITTAGNIVDNVISLGAIARGHKIALAEIDIGSRIKKYGEDIGVASQKIKRGSWVHVHNVDSCRGRGDLGGIE